MKLDVIIFVVVISVNAVVQIIFHFGTKGTRKFQLTQSIAIALCSFPSPLNYVCVVDMVSQILQLICSRWRNIKFVTILPYAAMRR